MDTVTTLAPGDRVMVLAGPHRGRVLRVVPNGGFGVENGDVTLADNAGVVGFFTARALLKPKNPYAAITLATACFRERDSVASLELLHTVPETPNMPTDIRDLFSEKLAHLREGLRTGNPESFADARCGGRRVPIELVHGPDDPFPNTRWTPDLADAWDDAVTAGARSRGALP